MCYRPPTRQISPYLSLSLEIKSYRIAASEEYLCAVVEGEKCVEN